MIKIEHIAIWVKDLELMKEFYCNYFNATHNEKYVNASKGFSSYFISFSSGTRLELMHSNYLNDANIYNDTQRLGLIHMAISVGSKDLVDSLTTRLSAAGYKILSGPRTTGDGYYESCISDPENNQIEITI